MTVFESTSPVPFRGNDTFADENELRQRCVDGRGSLSLMEKLLLSGRMLQAGYCLIVGVAFILEYFFILF
jgi:hypothetical protein